MPYICFSSITLNSGKTASAKIKETKETNKNYRSGMESTDPGSNSRHTAESSSTLESTENTSSNASKSVLTELTLDWYIGGALSVDATWLSIHQPPITPPSPSSSSSSSSSSSQSSESNQRLYTDGGNWSYLLESLDIPKVIPIAPSSTKGSGINRSRVIRNNSDYTVGAAKFSRQNNPDDFKDVNSASTFNGGVRSSSSTNSVGGIYGGRGGGEGREGDRRKAADVTFPIAVCYAQTGRGRWAEGGNPHHPQLYSATVKLSSTPLTSPLSDSRISSRSPGSTSTSTSTSNSTVRTLDFNMPPIYLPPGIYWLVSWTQVDRSWGDANQGEGSGTPESYLSNARTNTDWLSKQSEMKKDNTNINLRNTGNRLEEKVGIREEYARVKPRVIKGRKLWPSDPLILEIQQNGKVSIISSVLKCAWWSRTKEDPVPIFSNTTSTATSTSTARPSSQDTKEINDRTSEPSSNTQNTDFNYHDFVLRSKHRTAFWMVAISIILFIIRYLVHFFGCCIRDFSLCGGARRRDNAVYQRVRTTVT